jgi:uncharacterized protein with NAD-binding domain and iron-sulfur cluster
MSDRPDRVAIVGGGCAALAAAWELTSPALAGRYEITVYQMGWRLGGKGASGRGRHGRIEEHGLHLWMGHYDNAFRMMRECYEELARPSSTPFATWRDAFVPDPYVGLADRDVDGAWRRLMAYFPPLDGLPGDPRSASMPRTVVDYLARSVRLLVALVESAARVPHTRNPRRPEPADLRKSAARFVRYGQVVTLTAAVQALHTLDAILDALPGFPNTLLDEFVESLCDATGALIGPLLDEDPESQYLWEVIDIVLAQIRGTVRDGLLTDPRGFDAINDVDSRAWLQAHGAAPRSVDSAFMRGLYDLAFAYEDGDPERPGMAAGQGLRGGTRMFFDYRGALFWKMQAGMGDVVFAPLYEVLKRRGVRFEFFHKLTNVGLSPDEAEPHVATLAFDVQAICRDGEYSPLVDVRGLPCWPAEPLFDQLDHGAALRAQGAEFESAWDDTRAATRTLEVGTDFDFVVLGVSLGTIPLVCREVLASDRRWRDMVEHVKTVPTQCFQVWLDATLGELGWTEDPPNLSAFVEPFDTWADMSHLAAAENWPRPPASIGYFCNVLPCTPLTAEDLADPDYPARHHASVRANAIRFLDRDIVELWPKAAREGVFRWGLVNHGDSDRGELGHPFDSQFWTANVNPSDRYVLSLPGTIRYRISPLDETYDNLTIAGDWTDCGFNFGCVEAAVMSGRLASHALSQYPRLEDIDGYDHP